MKKTLLFSTLAFFTSVGAQALSWTGTQDLSAINAQIIDAGTTDYVLSPINTANPITEEIWIDGSSMGLVNSFTFDSGDVGNPYVMTDSTNQTVLQLNAVEANDITINGNITNLWGYLSAGRGVYLFNNSVVHNTLTIGGTINAGGDGVYLDSVTVSSLLSTADVTSNYDAFFIANAGFQTLEFSGTIDAGTYQSGIYLNNVTADSFTSTANFEAGGIWNFIKYGRYLWCDYNRRNIPGTVL